jgi:hypothetical protein
MEELDESLIKSLQTWRKNMAEKIDKEIKELQQKVEDILRGTYRRQRNGNLRKSED